ncbi:hypothetical protein GGTG_08859 [Gaeumannomyces tritici R3-111a-1]|uniref:Uncharacterized protein n=1 Tax=Gaeumannomyces tritici (strain R3-111a-1) TaxID=644352 RepID=J3P5R9_GAET3|nr:hypothetical protein GGTG_08859 [Gaeumannomyces tritici R3-111a-1]EJT75021.1 hypothetical protein GGTG_08859 [Gaeumannomyces tritici R3-111a-1]
MSDPPRAPYDPEFDPLLGLKQLHLADPEADDAGPPGASRALNNTQSHHLRTWEALVHNICATLGRDYIRKDLAWIRTPAALATLVSHLGIQRTSSRAALAFVSTVPSLAHLEALVGSLQRDTPGPTAPATWAAESESRIAKLERQLRGRQDRLSSSAAGHASSQTTPYESSQRMRAECDGCDDATGSCLVALCGTELAELDEPGWTIVWGLLFSAFECSDSNEIIRLCKALQRMCNRIAIVNRYVAQQGSCGYCGASMDADLRALVVSGLAGLLVNLVAAGRGTPVASLFERRLSTFEQQLEVATARASTLLMASAANVPEPVNSRVCPGCGSTEPEPLEVSEAASLPRSGSSSPLDEAGAFVVIP